MTLHKRKKESKPPCRQVRGLLAVTAQHLCCAVEAGLWVEHLETREAPEVESAAG